MLAVGKTTPAYAEQFLFMRVFNLHLQFSFFFSKIHYAEIVVLNVIIYLLEDSFKTVAKPSSDVVAFLSITELLKKRKHQHDAFAFFFAGDSFGQSRKSVFIPY